MSIVVDNDELNEDIGLDGTEAEGEDSPQEELEATSVDTFSMPEKFAGKSADEIAKSYMELEKEKGRKDNEVGELRKLTDQYIHQELTRRTGDDPLKESETPIEFDDLVEDPNKVVGSVVDNRVRAVNERIDQMEQARKVDSFMATNPDYQEIDASQEFHNWANASEYRVRQLNAARAGDLDAAGDILQGFRETKGALTDAAKKGQKVRRAKDLSNASTETAGTGQSPGKVFKRTELAKMMVNDPDKYYAMGEEIALAYSEDRVK